MDVLDEASAPSTVNSAIESFISLGLDGEHMCYILARVSAYNHILFIPSFMVVLKHLFIYLIVCVCLGEN